MIPNEVGEHTLRLCATRMRVAFESQIEKVPPSLIHSSLRRVSKDTLAQIQSKTSVEGRRCARLGAVDELERIVGQPKRRRKRYRRVNLRETITFLMLRDTRSTLAGCSSQTGSDPF